MQIHRSSTSATGGLTAEERTALEHHHRRWLERADRTDPIEAEKIIPAVIALYKAAGLPQPRVVLVPSPGVMAVASTFAAFIWEKRKTVPSRLFDSALIAEVKGLAQAVVQATVSAVAPRDDEARGNINEPNDPVNLTRQATFDGADAATANAQDRATIAAIQDSFDVTALVDMGSAIRNTMRDDFGNSVLTEMLSKAMDEWGLSLAKALFANDEEAVQVTQRVADWWLYCQSGNAWTYQDYQITAARDVLRLELPEYAAYAPWENCAIHGGYRYLHPEFCMVCDFPMEIAGSEGKIISPRSYRWRDGWTV